MAKSGIPAFGKTAPHFASLNAGYYSITSSAKM